MAAASANQFAVLLKDRHREFVRPSQREISFFGSSFKKSHHLEILDCAILNDADYVLGQLVAFAEQLLSEKDTVEQEELFRTTEKLDGALLPIIDQSVTQLAHMV